MRKTEGLGPKAWEGEKKGGGANENRLPGKI